MDDGAGEEAQDEHQEGGVEQDEQPHASEHRVHDVGDPAVGAQLDVADADVKDQEEDHHRRRELPEHLAEPDARGGCLGHRELLTDHHEHVDQRGDEVEGKDDLPVHAADHRHAQQGADDNAARPSRVQDVQVVSLLVAVERGDQRVDDGLADAVRDREDEHAPEQAEVGAGAGDVGVGVDGAAVDERRRHRHDHRQHVEGAREQQERLVAEAVEEEARDEDHQAEPDEASPRDLSEFRLREAEFTSPLQQEPAAHGETESGNKDGQEARNQ